MADRKISDLTALTTPATGDLIPIVDVSEAAAADKNKSITVGELLRGAPDGTAAAPGIAFESDGGNGMFLGGTDILAFSTGGTQAVTIDASQRLGVGVAIPNRQLQVAGATAITNSGDTGAFLFDPAGSVNTLLSRAGQSSTTAVDLAIKMGNTERLRIDSSGRLLVGTTTNSSPGGFNAKIQIADTSYTGSLSLRRDSNNNAAQSIIFGKSRGALNGNTIVQDDDILGYVSWFGADGTDLNSEAARISAHVDGTPGENDMPGRLVFSTTADGQQAPTERMRIDSSGNLLHGMIRSDLSATHNLMTAGGFAVQYTGTTGTYFSVIPGSAGGEVTLKADARSGAYPPMTFATGGTERARIDSSGRLLVGTTSHSGSQIFVVEGRTSDGTSYANIGFRRGSAPTSGNPTLAAMYFTDNSENQAAVISAEFDPGTWTSGSSHPGLLKFATTANGASSPTERMRITKEGFVTSKSSNIGSITGTGWSLSGVGELVLTKANATLVYINRTGSDGSLINFYQDGTGEGSIDVSGTTISYNGAHLSRWSQLPGGAERTEILRGSVLSNIDEMCEWGEEQNEQLNRMKVSDVEGDKNVAGVFQGWDDTDDTYINDFYCAMTGDFVIRIAQGVTVERGDLLMSAGDGTAKPQDDDIIRSKTIAKVTSTNVSCTYDDGSYCVPCVLMAC